MILVDSSVWIDHFHRSDDHLVSLLARDEAACHPWVIQELALGSLAAGGQTLALLGNLTSLPVLTHLELLALVAARGLWGRGLSPTDAHLLGAVLLAGAARLWTRDRALLAAAEQLGVAHRL